MVLQSPLLALGLILSSSLRAQAEEVKCWAPDGKTTGDNETYVPCNKLGITQNGVYSSCCLLDGEDSERDTCSTSGLCYNLGRGWTRGYCTDQTWKSPACVSVCTDPTKGGNLTGIASVTACGDSAGAWGCGDSAQYCGTDEAITIPTQASVVSSDEVNAANASLNTYKSATIALAAVCGVLALLTLASIFWLLKKNKALKHEVAAEKTPAPAIQHQQLPPHNESLLPSPSLHGNFGQSSTPTTHRSQFKHTYNGPYGSPNPSEAVPAYPGSQHNIQRYSELDGAAIARSEMGSPEPRFDRAQTPEPTRSP